MTADRLLREPPDGRCELVKGELITTSPAGSRHGRIALQLGVLVADHVKQNNLGVVFGAETGFLIARDPDTVRAPDVAFVTADRFVDVPGFFPGPPGLAVEVVSPDDKVKAVEDKAKMWIDHGARMVWLVWPNLKTVSVMEPGQATQVYKSSETLPGGDLLPGLDVPAADLFK